MKRCSACGEEDSTVSDSREREDGCIRRRRKCDACGHRWTTIEVEIEDARINVAEYIDAALEEAKESLTEVLRKVKRTEAFIKQTRAKGK